MKTVVERVKAAKLKSYMSDKIIFDMISEKMAASSNKMSMDRIIYTIEAFYKTALKAQLMEHKRMWIQNIGEFKQTSSGRRLCYNKNQKKHRKKVLHNRARSQSQTDKRRMLKKKDFPIS